MQSNLDKFNADLAKLIKTGRNLFLSMQFSCYPDRVKAALQDQLKDKTDTYLKDLPSVESGYQRWYSEALAVVRQVLPDRHADFVRHYEKPRGRKDITYDNYRVEDYLQGLHVSRGGEKIVGKDAAVPQFQQQLAILEAAEARFESSLFDIRQMVQADLMDSEMEAAEHLAKFKFGRAAGAIAGVVLERHLAQVCNDRQVGVSKRSPTIADFNESLKTANVIDLPQWRFIQHLADLRNLCDHARKSDPTPEQIGDLLSGVKKTMKTVY